MLCPGSRADFFFSHPLVQSPALGWVTMVIRVYVGITLAVTRVRGEGNGLCSMMHLGGLWGHGAGCCPRAQLPAERHQAALIKGEIGGMGAKHLQGAVTWTWTACELALQNEVQDLGSSACAQTLLNLSFLPGPEKLMEKKLLLVQRPCFVQHRVLNSTLCRDCEYVEGVLRSCSGSPKHCCLPALHCFSLFLSLGLQFLHTILILHYWLHLIMKELKFPQHELMTVLLSINQRAAVAVKSEEWGSA